MNKEYTCPSFEIIQFDVDCILTSGPCSTNTCSTNICSNGFQGDEGDNTYTVNCSWGYNC